MLRKQSASVDIERIGVCRVSQGGERHGLVVRGLASRFRRAPAEEFAAQCNQEPRRATPWVISTAVYNSVYCMKEVVALPFSQCAGASPIVASADVK